MLKLPPSEFWQITMHEFWEIFYSAFPPEKKFDHDKMKEMVEKFKHTPSLTRKHNGNNRRADSKDKR